MKETPGLDGLKLAGQHRSMRKWLRSGSIFMLIFGGLAVLGGALGFQGIVDVLLIGIGALLLLSGVWALAAPSPGLFILQGITFLMVGLFNISDWIIKTAASGEVGGSLFWMVLGFFQIGWAIQGFVRYGRYKHLSRYVPPPDLVTWVDQTAQVVQGRKRDQSEDIVEFTVTRFMGPAPWKGSLWDDMAMFLKGRGAGQEIVFAGRSEVSVSAADGPPNRKRVRANVCFGKDTMRVTIDPVSLARLRAWTTATVAAAPVLEPTDGGFCP